jgi:YHS domain-containing protein
MGFIKYNRKIIGPFGKKIKCEYCGKQLNNSDVEMLEHVHYQGGNYTPMYFCNGHLVKYFNDLNRNFLLEKL